MVHSSIDDSVINKEVYNKVAHLFTLSFDSKAMHITAVARLRNLIQDPVYWPSLLAMISTAPQETQKEGHSPVFTRVRIRLPMSLAPSDHLVRLARSTHYGHDVVVQYFAY